MGTTRLWLLILGALIATLAPLLAMAMPQIRADLHGDREATAAAEIAARPAMSTVLPSSPGMTAAVPASTPVTTAVITPAPGSAERAAILDALRQRLKMKSRFRVRDLRTAGGWAFVRATEVVDLDGGEEQETALSLAALLQLPSGSTTGWWRIAELWTLPGETERPLAAFTRSVRQRVRAERLPDALIPDDL